MESTTSNAGDAITNRYRGQTAAIIESIIPNAGNAIRNNQIGYQFLFQI